MPELVPEHFLGVDAGMKAGLTSLDRAADIVEAAGEDEIAEGPRGYLVVGDGLQP